MTKVILPLKLGISRAAVVAGESAGLVSEYAGLVPKSAEEFSGTMWKVRTVNSDSIAALSDTTETRISLGCDTWQNLDLTPMKVYLRNNFSKRYFFDTVRRTFIIEGIHNCFLDLFGSSVNYEIKSYDHQLPPSLKNIKNSCIGSLAATDAEKLEACFKNSPNQEYIILDGIGPLKLCQNSVINRTEYLDIYSRGTCGDDILMSFKGKSLNLIFVHFQQSTITKFLNNWKSNQGFQNLKFLCIHHYHDENLDIAKIMEETGVRWLPDDTVLKWRERNTPEVLNGQKEWNERSLVSRKYLDRDSDGERAFATRAVIICGVAEIRREIGEDLIMARDGGEEVDGMVMIGTPILSDDTFRAFISSFYYLSTFLYTRAPTCFNGARLHDI
ncbi:hypothetical protein GCK72_001258 [Caenorhabditis remanei]|uniref:F-box associated domain-containing protein n=1 Tax=Caenorhabditis remanei TaxID=31234 RepID=A0A6A5HQD3_CAERE|nr:hypothetical protein GCK72_001258 [Caenorhabditis remanei]KAF1769441.1 hypothetical protein GCK72_001258 [Caenorhabditis remanei]